MSGLCSCQTRYVFTAHGTKSGVMGCAREPLPQSEERLPEDLASSPSPYALVATTAVARAPAMAMASISISAPGIARLPPTVERAG